MGDYDMYDGLMHTELQQVHEENKQLKERNRILEKRNALLLKYAPTKIEDIEGWE